MSEATEAEISELSEAQAKAADALLDFVMAMEEGHLSVNKLKAAIRCAFANRVLLEIDLAMALIAVRAIKREQ